jgi:methyltransferase (TIGR00027 family)
MIKHVSDTSQWVAYYRALETERKDSLFKDPYANRLLDGLSTDFARAKSKVNKWTKWTVVMRTIIIDQMILDLIAEGVTTFVNLGCGLDSRPYRMNLGPKVTWIEVDFPHIIEHKKDRLKTFQPKCILESIALDLSIREERKKYFQSIAEKHERIAVLTEGVLPYLTEDQVSELSDDLRSFPSFSYWICEYISPKSYRFLKDPKRMKFLSHAPFQFFPEDWMGFFKNRGWKLSEEKYFGDISEKVGRKAPFPAIFKLLALFMKKEKSAAIRRVSGFLLFSAR